MRWLVLIILFLPTLAWAQANNFNVPPSPNCAGYTNSKLQGFTCITTGQGSFWTKLQGDVSIANPAQCSPANTTTCGTLKVNGFNGTSLSGTLLDGQAWCFQASSSTMIPCNVGSSGPLAGDANGSFGSNTVNHFTLTSNASAANHTITNLNGLTANGTTTFPSAVTNNISGFSVNGCVNPVAYGADPTGATDSAAAVNSAISAACTGQTDVCLPEGVIALKSPILDMCTAGVNIDPTSVNKIPAIYGMGRRSTFIQNKIGDQNGKRGGPSLEIAPYNVMGAGAVVTGLLASGNAFSFGNSHKYGFNLSEAIGTQPVNGNAAITVRAVAQPTTIGINQFIAADDGCTAFIAQGGNSIGPGFNGCMTGWMIFLGSDNKVYCGLKTSVTGWQLIHGSGTVSNNTTNQFQLDYDGANLRCFHGATGGGNMTLDAKQAMTGTVVEPKDTTMTLGYHTAQWYDLNASQFWNGTIDTFEVASVARCGSDTCASTSAQFAGDANSVLLENWTTSNTANLPLVAPERALANSGGAGNNAWTVFHNFGINFPQSQYPVVRDLAFINGNELIHNGGGSGTIQNVDGYGGNVNYGFVADIDGDYLSTVRGGFLNTNLLDIEFSQGLNRIYDFEFNCSQTCLLTEGSLVEASYFLPGSSATFPVVAGGTTLFDNDEWDVENCGTFAGLLATNIAASGRLSLTVQNVRLGPQSCGAKAPIQIDGIYDLISVRNTGLFHSGGNTGPMVDISSGGRISTLSNVEFSNDIYDGGVEPTDTAGDSFISTLDSISAGPPNFVQLAGGVNRNTTLNGTTSGTVLWSEPVEGQFYKKFIITENAYKNASGSSQTITYPLAFISPATIAVTTIAGTCTGLTTTNTTLTLPNSMAGTQTGICAVEGY